MHTRATLGFALMFSCGLAACGDDGAAVDAGPLDSGSADSGGADASSPDAGPPPYVLDGYCPGGAGCEAGADGTLRVGVAKLDVTPVIDATTDVQTVDVNGDGEFDPFAGDEFADNNDNGVFDGVWIAGFGNPRAATGVNDPQWVRAIALQNGDVTLVIAAIDCVGYFDDEVRMVREAVADLGVDYLSISATHSHESRDTLGIWGVDETQTGLDPAYMALLRDKAEQAIRAAVADLRPANIEYASLRLRDKPGGVLRYVSDSRDPVIIDDEVRLMRFLDAGTDTTIATLINWAAHAEYTGSSNQLLSSDFPNWLRKGVEEGVVASDGTALPGLGGVAVYVNGAVGSQIGPGRVRAQTWGGEDLPHESRSIAQNVGEQVASFVLEAFADGAGAVRDETADLGYRSHTFLLEIENRRYHVALLNRLFVRTTYEWDPDRPLAPGVNQPSIQTEVALMDIGRAQLILVPGELDPALFLGGYDGSNTPPGTDIVDLSATNPPDLSSAPAGPYLRDQARPDAEFVWLMGLANDEVGYFIPDFDYLLDRRNPYIDEAPGDHYEETNSVGTNGWPTMRGELTRLLEWTPEGGT
ncbi:MAG: hypothetical protein GXP55_22945 [Deltaproteobacteria bacterium]|nr:hypothetical protein [Deltaproteobacteria bacterium]